MLKILEMTQSGEYEAVKGMYQGKEFRIGRYHSKEKSITEDLKGNLSNEEFLEIFVHIDQLRRERKLL